VTAPVSQLYVPSTLGDTTAPVRTTWSASDTSGIASYQLQRQVNGGAWADVTLATPTSTSITNALTRGDIYRYQVRATDNNGNTSGWVMGASFEARLKEDDSTTIQYSGTWSTATSSAFSGGTATYSTQAGAYALWTLDGYSGAWVARKGPDRGSANVYVDGLFVTTISLYSSTYVTTPIVFAVGTAGHPRVDVDGFLRLIKY
jgi:hypothetical protein